MSPAERVRSFSGIQPTGSLHLGNYLGAVQQWCRLQDAKESLICVVDLHAITVEHDPGELRAATRRMVALLVACGIDPERTTLFVQSHVREHSELAWVLNCLTPLGWLERMTQYKSKAQAQRSVMTGLLTYPVLQAADILLYDADEVPVGEDQRQHIELSRDIAQRFNQLFGDTFVVPRGAIPEVGARIMGLDDPQNKMSKSTDVRGHGLYLTDSDDELRRSLRRAVTDSGREIRFSDDPERAGVMNLLTIYQALTGEDRASVEEGFSSARGYGDLKQAVADVVVDAVAPIRERYEALMGDESALDEITRRGAERARAIAAPKMASVRQRIGLLEAGGVP